MNLNQNGHLVITDIDAFLNKEKQDISDKAPKNNRRRKCILIFVVAVVFFLLLSLAVFLFFKKPMPREEFLAEIEKRQSMLFVDDMAIITEYDESTLIPAKGQRPPRSGRKCFYINKNGDMLFGKRFADAYPFYAYDVAVVADTDGIGGLRYGVIDKDGEYVISPNFYYLSPYFDEQKTMPAASFDGLYGYINIKGEWIIEPKYKSATYFNEFGVAVVQGDEYTAFVTRDGTEKRLPGKYSLRATEPSCGYYRVFNGDTHLFGFIDASSGDFAIDCVYDNAEDFVNGFACVTLPNGKTWIDTEGKIISNTLYYSVFPFNEHGLAVASSEKDSGFLLVNSKGEALQIVDEDIRDLTYAGEGLYIAKKVRNYQLINASGEKIGDVVLQTKPENFQDGVSVTNTDLECIAIDTNGNVLFNIPRQESGFSAESFCNSLALAKQFTNEGYRYFYINKNGEIAIDMYFANASQITSDGYAVVSKVNRNGKVIYLIIDTQGNTVYQTENPNIRIGEYLK